MTKHIVHNSSSIVNSDDEGFEYALFLISQKAAKAVENSEPFLYASDLAPCVNHDPRKMAELRAHAEYMGVSLL